MELKLQTSAQQRIWWLASYPKSGSTWVRMFLNAYISGFPVNLNSAFQYVTGDMQPQVFQLSCARPVTEMDDVDCIYYRMGVLKNYIYTSSTPDRALKTHHAKVTMDDIPLIPPKLTKGALYVIRDPRDIALSLADHLNKNIDETIDLMGNNQHCLLREPYKLYHVVMSWSSHVDSWTICNHDVNVNVVRYEDLLDQPEVYFPAVLKAMGIPDYGKKRLAFALEETEFDRLAKLESNGGFRERGKGEHFFRVGKAGQWRHRLTGEQIRRIEEDHSGAMGRFKYGLFKPAPQGLPRLQSVAAGTVE